MDSFLAFKAEHPSDLKLVLTGESHLDVPKHSDIDYRGFVPVEEKLALMAGAAVFVMPSAFESLSVATLEAMAQETPILVNGRCAVLADHVRQSDAGMAYTNHATFCEHLRYLLGREELRVAYGQAARRYVLERYRTEHIREKLLRQVALNRQRSEPLQSESTSGRTHVSDHDPDDCRHTAPSRR
jgi:glycosyltransferase involved in cell wall biosynthesis